MSVAIDIFCIENKKYDLCSIAPLLVEYLLECLQNNINVIVGELLPSNEALNDSLQRLEAEDACLKNLISVVNFLKKKAAKIKKGNANSSIEYWIDNEKNKFMIKHSLKDDLKEKVEYFFSKMESLSGGDEKIIQAWKRNLYVYGTLLTLLQLKNIHYLGFDADQKKAAELSKRKVQERAPDKKLSTESEFNSSRISLMSSAIHMAASKLKKTGGIIFLFNMESTQASLLIRQLTEDRLKISNFNNVQFNYRAFQVHYNDSLKLFQKHPQQTQSIHAASQPESKSQGKGSNNKRDKQSKRQGGAAKPENSARQENSVKPKRSGSKASEGTANSDAKEMIEYFTGETIWLQPSNRFQNIVLDSMVTLSIFDRWVVSSPSAVQCKENNDAFDKVSAMASTFEKQCEKKLREIIFIGQDMSDKEIAKASDNTNNLVMGYLFKNAMKTDTGEAAVPVGSEATAVATVAGLTDITDETDVSGTTDVSAATDVSKAPAVSDTIFLTDVKDNPKPNQSAAANVAGKKQKSGKRRKKR